MPKKEFPTFSKGDPITKVLDSGYQNSIVESMRRFNQITGGQGYRTTGPATYIPDRLNGPEKILTAKLLGSLGSGIGTTYGYTTAAAEIQTFDYEAGRPEDQDNERKFVITGFDVSLGRITISGEHASKFTHRHEIWLRDTEDANGNTRNGTYSVKAAANVTASSETEIDVYETIPSIIDPATSQELIKGNVWLWTPFVHMHITETETITDYRMVVNRSSSSFNKDDLVNILWVDDEYLILGSSYVIEEGYLIGPMTPATTDGTTVTPSTAKMATYKQGVDDSGDFTWTRKGQIEIQNMSVDAAGDHGTYVRAANVNGYWRLDWIDCNLTDASDLDLTDNS